MTDIYVNTAICTTFIYTPTYTYIHTHTHQHRHIYVNTYIHTLYIVWLHPLHPLSPLSPLSPLHPLSPLSPLSPLHPLHPLTNSVEYLPPVFLYRHAIHVWSHGTQERDACQAYLWTLYRSSFNLSRHWNIHCIMYMSCHVLCPSTYNCLCCSNNWFWFT